MQLKKIKCVYDFRFRELAPALASNSFSKTLIALGSPFPRWELDPFHTQNRTVPGCIASNEHRLRFHWSMHADGALHTHCHSLETIIDRNVGSATMKDSKGNYKQRIREAWNDKIESLFIINIFIINICICTLLA